MVLELFLYFTLILALTGESLFKSLDISNIVNNILLYITNLPVIVKFCNFLTVKIVCVQRNIANYTLFTSRCFSNTIPDFHFRPDPNESNVIFKGLGFVASDLTWDLPMTAHISYNAGFNCASCLNLHCLPLHVSYC